MNNTIENDDDWKDFESRLSSDGQSLKRAVEVEKINVGAVGSDNRSSLVKYLSSRIGNIEKQERKREAKERSRKEIRIAKERIAGGGGGKKKKKKGGGRVVDRGLSKQEREKRRAERGRGGGGSGGGKALKMTSKEFPTLG